MQGNLGYFERLVPQTTSIAHKQSAPATANAAFIAPNSSIVGNATVAESASVWYGCNIRGDAHPVKIGEGSVIGDRATIAGANIGADVLVGPNATIRGAVVGDGAVIGANTIVGAGVKIGARAIVEAGSVVPEGTTVEAGQVYAGNPAASVRAATEAESAAAKDVLSEQVELARTYQFEADKTDGDLYDEEEEKHFQQNLESDHWADQNYDRIPSRRGNLFNRRNVA